MYVSNERGTPVLTRIDRVASAHVAILRAVPQSASYVCSVHCDMRGSFPSDRSRGADSRHHVGAADGASISPFLLGGPLLQRSLFGVPAHWKSNEPTDLVPQRCSFSQQCVSPFFPLPSESSQGFRLVCSPPRLRQTSSELRQHHERVGPSVWHVRGRSPSMGAHQMGGKGAGTGCQQRQLEASANNLQPPLLLSTRGSSDVARCVGARVRIWGILASFKFLVMSAWHHRTWRTGSRRGADAAEAASSWSLPSHCRCTSHHAGNQPL